MISTYACWRAARARLAAGGHAGSSQDPQHRCRHRAADRLREPDHAPLGPWSGEKSRDGAAACDWRVAVGAREAADDRKPDSGRPRWRRGVGLRHVGGPARGVCAHPRKRQRSGELRIELGARIDRWLGRRPRRRHLELDSGASHDASRSRPSHGLSQSSRTCSSADLSPTRVRRSMASPPCSI